MTTRNRFIAAMSLLVVAGAFFAGFWPERQRRTALDAENASLRVQAATLEDYARLARLHVQVLNLIDEIAAMNYGQAQTLSSTLFDDLRAEAGRTHSAPFRTMLNAMLATRDQITAALAKGDAAVLESVRQTERQLRGALAELPAQTI